MKTLQLLVATMYQTDYSLLDRLKLDSDAVIVNQCDTDSRESFIYNGHHVCWINSSQRGLSKSRNMALSAATADICVICDEDMVYRDGYGGTIAKAFDEHPQAHLLRFEVEGIEGVFKHYDHQAGEMSLLGSMKASSVEIAFRREAILEKGIRFDELIGAGTQFPMGEENAFLFACLRSKLKLFYVPQVIADLHIGKSTWFDGFGERYFLGRGAAFAAMDRKLSGILIWQFALRKYKKYSKNMSLFKAIGHMKQGRKLYLEKKV